MPFRKRPSVVLLTLIVFLAGCSRPPQGQPTSTLIAPAQVWDDETSVRAVGSVVPVRQIDLSFPLSGQIVNWSVKEGDTVHQGDVLAQLDSTVLEDDVAQYEAARAVAQANLDAAVARTDPALAAFPGSAAISRAEVLHAQKVIDLAKARLAQATLVAPIDGTVMAIYVDQYEYALEGKPVIQLGDLSRMQVKAELGEMEAARVIVGNTAAVTFDSMSGVEVQGQVTSITPRYISGSGTKFLVIVDLHDIPRVIQPGITTAVLISTR